MPDMFSLRIFAAFLFVCWPLGSFSEELPCKSHELGCDEKFFSHYQALNGALDAAISANPALVEELGEEVETAYHSVWLQRFESGAIFHISQRVPFGAVKLESHEGGNFILEQSSNQFLFHWRPPVPGIYDVDLLTAIMKYYPRDPDLFLNWSIGHTLSETEIADFFRPHTESSPRNISGGLATLYAMYRLDQYLGRPLEQQFTRVVLRRNYKAGYVLVGLPDPAASALAGDATEALAEDVNHLYIFKIEREPIGSTDTDRYGGGKKFRAGSWKTAKIDLGEDEKNFRPKRGLFSE
ncbi:MAG TPA: hypothetical protein PLH57_05915 [Oligoflexia bacterium]|nr:hypothetical protein [Oligoflexia bacterium]